MTGQRECWYHEYRQVGCVGVECTSGAPVSERWEKRLVRPADAEVKEAGVSCQEMPANAIGQKHIVNESAHIGDKAMRTFASTLGESLRSLFGGGEEGGMVELLEICTGMTAE